MTAPQAVNPFSARVRIGKLMLSALSAQDYQVLHDVDQSDGRETYAPWVIASLIGATINRAGGTSITMALPERQLLWDAADAIAERAEMTVIVTRARALQKHIETINARRPKASK